MTVYQKRIERYCKKHARRYPQTHDQLFAFKRHYERRIDSLKRKLKKKDKRKARVEDTNRIYARATFYSISAFILATLVLVKQKVQSEEVIQWIELGSAALVVTFPAIFDIFIYRSFEKQVAAQVRLVLYDEKSFNLYLQVEKAEMMFRESMQRLLPPEAAGAVGDLVNKNFERDRYFYRKDYNVAVTLSNATDSQCDTAIDELRVLYDETKKAKRDDAVEEQSHKPFTPKEWFLDSCYPEIEVDSTDVRVKEALKVAKKCFSDSGEFVDDKIREYIKDKYYSAKIEFSFFVPCNEDIPIEIAFCDKKAYFQFSKSEFLLLI
ncbi:MAG: hypothetical protein FWD16_06370 [Clostridia bacterium]|nr:hypothetical protein [Clostridia bacterium]